VLWNQQSLNTVTIGCKMKTCSSQHLKCCEEHVFFWVMPWRLNFMPTFRNTLPVPSSQAGRCRILHLPAYEDQQTECSETSAYKIQTSGNYPEENMQSTEHGESLKSRIVKVLCEQCLSSHTANHQKDFRRTQTTRST
jgi:hypothetical protein